MDHSLRRSTPAGPAEAHRYVELGVLAHVDAGKTSLTEALLLAGGAVDRLGRVDDGTTQTDTLALERRRGITIRTAVATFRVGDVTVNLVDTPGHPDFIAEVDRSLAVLDGAVLVVSAVEGVQAQTVVLHRALLRRQVPTIVFVNKIDRSGADPVRVAREIAERLDVQLVRLGGVTSAGTPEARLVPMSWDDPSAVEEAVTTLAESDDVVLAEWLAHGRVEPSTLHRALGRLTRSGAIQPLLFGSARTGAGVPELIDVVATLLVPDDAPDPTAPLDGQVFKVEHDPTGRRACTVRLRAGGLAVRDRVRLGDGRTGTVTGLEVFEPGGTVPQDRAVAGQVVRVLGLSAARVDDVLGRVGEVTAPAAVTEAAFAPPALQSTVVARDPRQQGALHRALAELADGDPLIRVRPDAAPGVLRIDVYGEVQREVIAQTLADEHGIEADFSPPAAACVERPAGTGVAARRIGDPGHHPPLTVGVRVSPGRPGSGPEVVVAAERLTLPLHVYGTVEGLRTALLEHLDDALALGPQGWPVTDVVVTLVESGYVSPAPAPADLRRTFALVVTEALQSAGTLVCEPVDVFRLETPTASVSGVLGLVLQHRATPGTTLVEGGTTVITGEIPSVEVDAVRTGLPSAAHGLAVLESSFDHHAPVRTSR